MNVPRYAAAAAKLLARHVTQATPPAGDRELRVATIERAMFSRTRRRRLLGSATLLAGAAALALTWQAARWTGGSNATAPTEQVSISASPTGRGASLRGGGHDLPLAQRAELKPGQRIETPADGGASLQLSTGTLMQLASGTAFQVSSQGATQRFALNGGQLTAQVAKLDAGHRFIVTTPDAEIEVRGTRFRLNVLGQTEPCSDSRTRLEVTEGVVEVRVAGGSTEVRAAQSWPANCVVPAQPRPATLTRSDLEARRAAHGKAHGAAALGVNPATQAAAERPAAEGPSALTRQNDLFAEGVALRRQGDFGGALRAYQDLIAQFPNSPLAENAMVERMRLLAAKQRSRGHEEARRYLARYPRGFAANEAHQLLDLD